MALPWMESRQVWGEEPARHRASEAPVRFAALFSGNGFHSKEWWARGEGAQMELGKVLAQRILAELTAPADPPPSHDGSTNALIRRCRVMRRK